jgi:hypothetical protein
MRGKTCSSTALYTTTPTWNTLQWNSGLCDKKPSMHIGTHFVKSSANIRNLLIESDGTINK